jgi:hypothetical protein
MTTAYTSLLGLALPVTGELSGTWGTTVNDAITSLLDSAVAGTTTISSDADVTLTTTTGAANTARPAILLWTAGGTVTRNITAPAQSKTYIVINKSSSTQSIVLRGVGPTTGVTIIKGEAAVCAWNGSDFIKVSNISGAGTFSSITNTGLTSGRVVYSTTGGLETDSANLLFDGTTLTASSITSKAATALTLQSAGTTAVTVDASQNVGIGTSSPTTLLQVYNATSSILQVDGDATANIRINRYSTDTNSAAISIRKARGTFASPTAVASGDTVASFQGSAYGGTTYRNVGLMAVYVDTYTSDTNISGYLSFQTNSGSTGTTERMRIDSSGNVLVGTSSQIKSSKQSIYSGATNATTYNTASFQGGSVLTVQNQQTTSVSTSAVTIATTGIYATLAIVYGSDGTNRFQDLVMFSIATGTVNVINSLAVSGSPASRTYSQASSTYKLAMGSGTYTVQFSGLSQGD